MKEFQVYGEPAFTLYDNSMGDADGHTRDSQAYGLTSSTSYELRVKPITGISQEYKGEQDYALILDGIDGFADYKTDIPILGGGDMTIESWVNINQDTPSEMWLSGVSADVRITGDEVGILDDVVYSSCEDARARGYTMSGTYTVDVAGVHEKVYCEMSTWGGGWTLIASQRSGDYPWMNFNSNGFSSNLEHGSYSASWSKTSDYYRPFTNIGHDEILLKTGTGDTWCVLSYDEVRKQILSTAVRADISVLASSNFPSSSAQTLATRHGLTEVGVNKDTGIWLGCAGTLHRCRA